MQQLFFELIQISLGNREELERIPSDIEWTQMLELAQKQSLTGLLFDGMAKCLPKEKGGKPSSFFEWYALQQRVIALNTLQNKRAQELYEIFKEGNYRSCVLKGQGTATYYDRPEIRQSGDIDLWVEDERDEVVEFVRSKGILVENVDIKDSTMYFFNDVMVEVHWRPNCMYNPWTDRRLQSFFKKMSGDQFEAFDEKMGFTHTTIEFDLVYSLVHIYRHIFSEGIGLRQLVDYFYILKRATVEQRKEAFKTICSFGMKSFAGGIMYILQEKFDMDKEFALCNKNKRHGEFLLNEIMIGGNFGHYDTRYSIAGKDKKFKRGISMLRRNLHYIALYPSEVLWSPLWKLWHWGWRIHKGYL